MTNQTTLKLPVKVRTEPTANAAAEADAPTAPLEAAHPVHHVRYPLLKAFWRDSTPASPAISTVRRRLKTPECS
jgi:hypothetical protein